MIYVKQLGVRLWICYASASNIKIELNYDHLKLWEMEVKAKYHQTKVSKVRDAAKRMLNY
jgi:hypothetical protein